MIKEKSIIYKIRKSKQRENRIERPEKSSHLVTGQQKIDT